MTHATYASRVSAHPSRTGGARTQPVRWLVIHTSEGNELPSGAENLAAFISRPATSGNVASYHYIADNDKVIPIVPDDRQAYAASGGNNAGLHICHPGKAAQTRDQWFDEQSGSQLEQVARWLADKAAQYGVPLGLINPDQVRAGVPGICGHHEITQAFKISTHTDPGKSYPWDWVISRALQVSAYVPPVVDPGWPPFDPANGKWGLMPLAPKLHTWEGGQGDTVAYAQGVMKRWVSLFANHFLVGGYAHNETHALYLAACRDTSGNLKIDGQFGNVTATAVEFMQRAFRWTSFDNQQWGDIPAAHVPFGQIDAETWAFIDAQANGVWAG
jgi:N-acetyl-anhydromuramyl-L-alanine amidase AmpD